VTTPLGPPISLFKRIGAAIGVHAQHIAKQQIFNKV
jgi:hypothetical protein